MERKTFMVRTATGALVCILVAGDNMHPAVVDGPQQVHGAHENHGFFLHGDSFHYMGKAYCRESKEIRKRPAILVVYEPR